MTKADLIALLAPLPDDAPVEVVYNHMPTRELQTADTTEVGEAAVVEGTLLLLIHHWCE